MPIRWNEHEFWDMKKTSLPTTDELLPGRASPIPTAEVHFVNRNVLKPPFPKATRNAMFGMGCFWGAEKRFWLLPGVYVTAVGYAGGGTPNPTYEEVCTGRTGHNEVVLVVYEEEWVSYQDLLKLFWESHDPTQGMRQGNDIGTQYRSGIYTYTDEQHYLATASRSVYAKALTEAHFSPVATEILPAPGFYYAEEYHQQYLARNPAGYCGIGGTGIRYRI